MTNSYIVLLWETAHHRVKWAKILDCVLFSLLNVILGSYGTPLKFKIKKLKKSAPTDISANPFLQTHCGHPRKCRVAICFLEF